MRRLLKYTTVLLLQCILAQAQSEHKDDAGNSANDYMHQTSHEELAKAFDSTERDSWQRPDTVIAYLGDMTGKTIIDLGSGSGYFTFRLLETGAKVIAADVDEEFLSIIEKKRQNYNFENGRLSTVLLDENRLNVENGTADVIFMVNVYHHIEDRINYFSQANAVLKEGGKIIIIDFYKKSIPVGPPKHHKIGREVILNELKEAGYKNIRIDTELLEYQYLIEADRF